MPILPKERAELDRVGIPEGSMYRDKYDDWEITGPNGKKLTDVDIWRKHRDSNGDFDYVGYLTKKHPEENEVEKRLKVDSKGNKHWASRWNEKDKVKEKTDVYMSQDQFDSLQPYAKEKSKIQRTSKNKRKAQSTIDKAMSSAQEKHDKKKANESLSLKESSAQDKFRDALVYRILTKEFQEAAENYNWGAYLPHFYVESITFEDNVLRIRSFTTDPYVYDDDYEDCVENLYDCFNKKLNEFNLSAVWEEPRTFDRDKKHYIEFYGYL